MGEFGSNQEFHPEEVISKHYNYVTDYFELRAQRGRDGLELPSDDYWLRNGAQGYLYPAYLDDTVIINGVVPVSDEKLRVVGAVDAYEYRMADTYMKNVGNDLIFYDPNYGSEISLSDLISGYFSRDDINSFIYPTNTNDSLLLGLSSGEDLRRLQIKSEADNGSSYLIYGLNSFDTHVFSIDDLGNVNMGEVFSMDGHTINVSGDDMVLDNHIHIDHISGSIGNGSTWQINSTNPYYSRHNHEGDGLGFPADDEMAIWLNSSINYRFTQTSLHIPQEAWIISGINMVRVNSTDQIELGNFTFDNSESKMLFSPDTYIYRDPIGNLTFTDLVLGEEVTLSQLLSISDNYWTRDEATATLETRYSGDSLKIPSLGGSVNLSLFVTPDGDVFSGSYTQYWIRNEDTQLVSLYYPGDSVVIGKDDYANPSPYKFEVWSDNNTMLMGVGADAVINVPTNVDGVELSDGNVSIVGGKSIYFNTAKTTRMNQVVEGINAVEFRVGGNHVVTWENSQITYFYPIDGYEARFGLITDRNSAGVNIEATNYIDFKLDYVPVHAEGRLHWDDDDKTLEIGTEVAGIYTPIGQVIRVRATNNTGVTIPNGSVVYTTGALGHRPTIALAQANFPWTAAPTLGVTTHDIPNNTTGYITIVGMVRNVDTSACADGCLIWLSPDVPGGWTGTIPSAPNTRVVIGTVLYSHATEGIILTESATFQNLSGMPDVTLTSIADTDLLTWNSTNTRWENVVRADLGADLSYWDRTGTVLSPKNIGDSVEIDDGSIGQSIFGTGMIINNLAGIDIIYDFAVKTVNYNAIYVNSSDDSVVIMNSTLGKIGFLGEIPTIQSTGWTLTNDILTKILDANATTINELADLLASLANELKTKGLLGG